MISAEQVQGAVGRIVYHRLEGTHSCVCALVLQNGHVVIGEAHCAPGTEFDPELAMKYSRADAEAKVAGLLAFQARGRIYDLALPRTLTS